MDIPLENGNSINIQGISGLNIKTVKNAILGELSSTLEVLDIIETKSYPQGAA